jgi:succinate dehydrogenase/fumarate reductase flavoprotein subunit
MPLTRITEPAREIDVIHETDVLVVGSGPDGLAAALAAAPSLKAGRELQDVKISDIHKELDNQGVRYA